MTRKRTKIPWYESLSLKVRVACMLGVPAGRNGKMYSNI